MGALVKGDGDSESPRLHRRAGERGSEVGHLEADTSRAASTPGKSTRTGGLPVAAPGLVASNAVRAAHGAATRIDAFAEQLRASLARGDQLETQRLSFEIRDALRRARRGISDAQRQYPRETAQVTAEIERARDRLAMVERGAGLLVDQAPASSWHAEAAEIGTSLGLGSVDVQTDDVARATTEREGARGVALGNVVYLHPDRVHPGTTTGREVLAHELVHLAQARLPSERDAGRDTAELEASDIAKSIARGGTARRPEHHIDLSRPAADRHAAGAEDAAPDRRRGEVYLKLRLTDIIDKAVHVIPYQPSQVDGLRLEGPAFSAYLQKRIRSYVDEEGIPGLRALVTPADLVAVVAAVAPKYRRELMDDDGLTRVVKVVGDELARAVTEAFARVAPRIVAGARKEGSAAWLTSVDIAHDGHMDVLVVDALMRPHIASVEVAAAEVKRADSERAHKRHAAKTMSAKQAADLLDQTARLMQSAGEKVGPWKETVSEATRDWVDQQRYWIHGQSDAKLAALGPLIDAGATTVKAAEKGISEVTAKFPVPPNGPDAPEAALVRRVLARYCKAIKRAHEGGAGRRDLARADRAAKLLTLDMIAAGITENRDAVEAVTDAARDAGDRTTRLRNAPEYARKAREAERALEAELRTQRQRVVIDEPIDPEAGAEISVAAGEQAIETRLESLVIKSHSLILMASRSGAKDAVSRATHLIAGPVHRIETAYTTAKAKTVAWLATQQPSPATREEHRRRRQEATDAATAALAKLAADDNLTKQFNRALEEIHDWEVHKALTEIALLIGVSIATGQFARAFGGLVRGIYLARTARGALLAERTAGLLATGTTLVADSFATTKAQRVINGGASGNTWLGDLFSNSAALLVLRPFTAVGKHLDEVDDGAKLSWARKGKRWVLKGAVASWEVIGATAVGYATQRAQEAGTASPEQQVAWLEQAASIALAKLLSTKLQGLEQRLDQLGDDAGRALVGRLRGAKRLAAKAEGGSQRSLPAALDEYQALVRLEGDLLAQRVRDGHDVAPEIATAHKADSKEISPERVAMVRWKHRGLDLVKDDGSLWLGSRDQIEAAIADAGPEAAKTVHRESDGRVRLRLGDQDVVLAPRDAAAPNLDPVTRDAPRASAEPTKTPEIGKRSDGSVASKTVRGVVINEIALVAPAGTRVIDQQTLELQAKDGSVRVTIAVGESDKTGHATHFERTADGGYRVTVSDKLKDEQVTRALAQEMVRVRRDFDARSGGTDNATKPSVELEARSAELRVLFAEIDRVGTRGGEGTTPTSSRAEVDALLREIGVDGSAASRARLREVLAFDPELLQRAELHLAGFEARPVLGAGSDLSTFAAQRQARLDDVAAHVAGPNASAMVEVEGMALAAQLRLEEGHRVFDPSAKAKAKPGSPGDVALKTHRAGMVTTLNDPNLSIEQRRSRLQTQIDELAADPTLPESLKSKIDINAMREAASRYGASGQDHGAMTLDVASGQVTRAGSNDSPTTMRALMHKVDAANQAAVENGLAIEYVLIVHRPAKSDAGAELAHVEVLARRKPQSRVSPRGATKLPANDGQGDLIVDVGVGRGGFAAESATMPPGSLLVQTDYIGNAEVGQISRTAPGITDPGPVSAPRSVMVFTDFLMRPDLFRGTAHESGTAGIRQVFINNVSAKLDAAQYWELAEQLAANMADGGTVEVQWTMSPESPGAKQGSRNHIEGDRLVDYLHGSDRRITHEVLPVVGQDFTIDAATRTAPDPDRVAEYTPPVPEQRIVITFHGPATKREGSGR